MNQVKLQVEIADAELCPRYQAVVMQLPEAAPSNYLLPEQTFVARSGMRSIDRVVDVTNELMLLTGQPLHAFDFDKLVKVGGLKNDAAKTIVRAAKPGEKLELLDGKTIEMSDGDIVITSNDVPVALAGAMGGANTAIDARTRRIVIESATFNLYNLRGTQFRHGIFSEAITRFTKGQPAALTEPVIARAIELYQQNCGATPISDVADAYPKPVKNAPVKLDVARINGLLGANYELDEIVTTLADVGFKVKLSGDRLAVTAPYWRTDIRIAEDVIEEVGRLKGFDGIPAQLPPRSFAAPAVDKLGDLKSKARQALSAAGANEILTYSFVNSDLMQKAGQDPQNSYKIVNSISPDLQYVRQSLTPSLLEKVYSNLRDGLDHFALFEINQVYQKKWGLTDEDVPVYKQKLAFVLASKTEREVSYYDAKKYVNALCTKLGVNAKFTESATDNATDNPFQNGRRAKIEELTTGEVLGVVGEYKASVLRNFKLPRSVAGFELILDTIAKFAVSKTDYKSPSRFPSVERDLTFRVATVTEYAALENLVCKNLSEQGLWFELSPVSIYQSETDKSTKNISFRLTFADHSKTLNGDEIAAVVDKIAAAAKDNLSAEVI